MVKLNNQWDELLYEEFKKEYYLKLREFLKVEYANYRIFPSMYDIFNALKYTDYKDVKVVILGQDPYHEIGQAHGLCFSVLDNVPLPASLKNIFKELTTDLNIPYPKTGNLTKWAKQGVLLLNTVLTVREHYANSHKNKGWEIFTNHVIELLNQRDESIVFVLWGNDAKQKKSLITNPKHVILTASHPSPLSAFNGFFGCRHFSKINEILLKNHQLPIDWSL
ncbi:MAG: uracil-DNA glycosylase [Bacilli bacterium]|jgi:uracil-DNA glycosylase|nr:uracil-DNA glycosylase [Staphylococcus sp.]